MTTKHTCGGPVFGKKTPGCPRCDELLSGAAPVQWAGTRNREWERREAEYARKHRATCTDTVCTYGEW